MAIYPTLRLLTHETKRFSVIKIQLLLLAAQLKTLNFRYFTSRIENPTLKKIILAETPQPECDWDEIQSIDMDSLTDWEKLAVACYCKFYKPLEPLYDLAMAEIFNK
jgi:hypothetical protein